MDTVLYDSNGRVIHNHDLQDKKFWCGKGERLEHAFVRIYGNTLKYNINPARNHDKYAPDLINSKSSNLADLKTQNTPFFKSNALYKFDPTYTVVFNDKDKLRYERFYPSIEIVFWIEWIAVKALIKGQIYEVASFKGVFRTSFKNLAGYLKHVPIHYYTQRKYDTLGNAKGSYVLDIRHKIFEKII